MTSEAEEKIHRLWDCESDRFSEIVMAAHLDLTSDFVGANFAGMSLAGEHLDRFNFEGADFRECDITGTTFRNCTLRRALFSTRPDAQNSPGFEIAEPGELGSEISNLMRAAEEESRQEERTAALRQLARHISKPRVAEFFRARALRDDGQVARSFAETTLRNVSGEPAKVAKEIAFGRMLSYERRYGTIERFIRSYIESYGDDDDIVDRVAMLASGRMPYGRFLEALPESVVATPAFKQVLLAIAQGSANEDAQTAAIQFMAGRFKDDPQFRSMIVRLTSMPTLDDNVKRVLVGIISYDPTLSNELRPWLIQTIAMSPYIRLGWARAQLLRDANPKLLDEPEILSAYVAATSDVSSPDTRQAAFKTLLEFVLPAARPVIDVRPWNHRIWRLVNYGHDPMYFLDPQDIKVLARAYSVSERRIKTAFRKIESFGVPVEVPD